MVETDEGIVGDKGQDKIEDNFGDDYYMGSAAEEELEPITAEGEPSVSGEDDADKDDADTDMNDDMADDYLDDAYGDRADDFLDDYIVEDDYAIVPQQKQQQQISNKYAENSFSFSDMTNTTYIIPVIILLVIVIGFILKRKRNNSSSNNAFDASADTRSTPGANVNYDFVDPSCRGGFQKQRIISASDDYDDEDGWSGYDNIQLT